MSQLKQIQIAYSPVEDRLLLRINTADREEFRFWITRRYLKVLWQAIGAILAQNPQVRTQAGTAAKQTVLSFQHEKAISEADFSRRFEEGAQALPLGTAPVLLTRVQTRRTPEGNNVVGMHPEAAQGVELVVNEGVLHGLSRLIADAAGKADWDLGVLKRPERVETIADVPTVN